MASEYDIMAGILQREEGHLIAELADYPSQVQACWQQGRHGGTRMPRIPPPAFPQLPGGEGLGEPRGGRCRASAAHRAIGRVSGGPTCEQGVPRRCGRVHHRGPRWPAALPTETGPVVDDPFTPKGLERFRSTNHGYEHVAPTQN